MSSMPSQLPPAERWGSRNAPQLAGARVTLRPVTPPDYPFLFDLTTDPSIGYRWRLRGAVPSPAGFETALWEQVFAQFVIWDNRGPEPCGLVTAYAADARNRIAYFAIVHRQRAAALSSVPVDALLLFLQYLFTVWDFRKLYAESPEYAYEDFASGAGKYFEVEARLPEYHYFDGKYWDNLVISVSRERFAEIASRTMSRVLDRSTSPHGDATGAVAYE